MRYHFGKRQFSPDSMIHCDDISIVNHLNQEADPQYRVAAQYLCCIPLTIVMYREWLTVGISETQYNRYAEERKCTKYHVQDIQSPMESVSWYRVYRHGISDTEDRPQRVNLPRTRSCYVQDTFGTWAHYHEFHYYMIFESWSVINVCLACNNTDKIIYERIGMKPMKTY